MTAIINIYLAPFQSITTHTFRKTFARHFNGINKFYTPFFAKIDHEKRISPKKQHELQHLSKCLPEVVPQILSKDPDEIIRFARICADLGFTELNWNLGCPYPQVADKKRGSGILPYPDMVRDILEKVMPLMPVRFSIKCRLGYETQDEILKLIPVFNSYPIYELTIHGRIGRQLYSGEADHNAIAKLLPLLNVPFVHNGDILSYPDFRNVSMMLPDVSTWMIGRGILFNPFLSEEIKGLNVNSNKPGRLKNFLDDLYFAYRSDMNDRLTVLNLLKEYWDYLQYSFPNPQQVKRIIKKARTFEEYEDAVKSLTL